MPENSSTRTAKLIAWISVATFALAGCAELPAPAPITEVDYRGCVLSQSDSLDPTLTEVAEYSMNQAAVTYGIQRTDLAVKATKLTTGVKKLVQGGCKLVVVSGADFGAGMVDVATKYPDVNFVYFAEKAEAKIASANLDNLVAYGVDLFEVGIISGFLSADLSTNHYISLACTSGIGETILSGARFGVEKFEVPTQFDSSLADVQIVAGCKDELVATDAVHTYVGYGLDNFHVSRYDAIKDKFATTVVPLLGSKLMDVVAADLESDFIGGSLGSVTATYGNGMLALSPEHNVPLSSATLTKLQTVIADYEATLK